MLSGNEKDVRENQGFLIADSFFCTDSEIYPFRVAKTFLFIPQA